MKPLGIAITCYPTFGGSGIVATELGAELARRGHEVHFVCAEMPWRLGRCIDNVTFHEVIAGDYPLFDHVRGHDSYVLALCSKLVEVATYHKIDVFHMHYAIPHATAAALAQQILGERAPRLVTTLHGTDATLVGKDPSFLPITRFSVEQSNGVTVPSQFLAGATRHNLGLHADFPIEVIANFVDTDEFVPTAGVRRPRIVHNSNFRPIKRVPELVRVFAEVRRQRECELVLIGDGPERGAAERLVHELGLVSSVRFLGKQHDFLSVVQSARVFLQTSESESFGLAALEAQACGVPVVSTAVGGVGEVIEDGVSGTLCPLGDRDRMVAAVMELLDDEPRFSQMAGAARHRAVAHFGKAMRVDQYVAFYRRLLDG